MLTLTTLAIWTVLGTIGTILLLIDGYKQHAKILFFQITLAPVGFILFLILIIGLAPMPR